MATRTLRDNYTPKDYCRDKSYVRLRQRENKYVSNMAAMVHREPIQKQIEQDWANREYIEVITGNIKRITDFLNSFDLSCRSRLASLNEKLTTLERRIEYLEARVTKGETLT